MAEYPLDEAEKILSANVESATSSLSKFADDLDYLKDQITITEVSTFPVTFSPEAANNLAFRCCSDIQL
jgi:hypothetical protein